MLLTILLFPVYIYTSIKMLDYISFYLQTILARFLYFVSPFKISKLRTSRGDLVKDILSFVNQFISEADPKYAAERIIRKRESDRGDTEKEIIMRRNSFRKREPSISMEVNDLLSKTS
jgi:hypothetical protein